MKFTSLCFKDASGTSHPKKVYETIINNGKILIRLFVVSIERIKLYRLPSKNNL